MAKRTLLLCRGSHCRKRLAKAPRVEATLAELPVEVETVGCQKVCRGPVVGWPVAGELQWFERMSSKKALCALEELVRDDALARPVRKRRCAKRAGRLRR